MSITRCNVAATIGIILVACGQALQSQGPGEMSTFDKGRQDLSFPIKAAVDFAPGKVKSDMTYTELKDVDPYGFNNLNVNDRKKAKEFAIKIKKFLDAYGPGGKKYTDAELREFDNEVKLMRRSSNPAISDMAFSVSVLLMTILPEGE